MPRKVYEAKGVFHKRPKRPFVKEVIKEVQRGEDLFDTLFAQNIKVVKQKAIRERENLQIKKIKKRARPYYKNINHSICRPAGSPSSGDSFDALLKGSFYQVPKHESTIDLVSESNKSKSVAKKKGKFFKLIEDCHVECFKEENSGKEFKKSDLVSDKYAEIQRNFPNILEERKKSYLDPNSTFTNNILTPSMEPQCANVANLGIESSTPITQKKKSNGNICLLSPIVPVFARWYKQCELKGNSSLKENSSDFQTCEIPINHSLSEPCGNVEGSSLDKTCSDKRNENSCHQNASRRKVLADMNVCFSPDIFVSYDNDRKFDNFLCDEHNTFVLNKSVTSLVGKNTSTISNSLPRKENCKTVEESDNDNLCSDECDVPGYCGTSARTVSVKSVVCNSFYKFASSVILKEHSRNDVLTSNNSSCGESNSSAINISKKSEEKDSSYVSNFSFSKVNCRRGGNKKKSTHIKMLSHRTENRRSKVDSRIIRSPSFRPTIISRKSHLVIPLESYVLEDSVSTTGFREAHVGSTNSLLHSRSNNRLPENNLSDVIEMTFKDIVLQHCGQTEILNFADVFSDSFLAGCKKIGEGVYGEVFSCQHPGENSTVLKILPIEGDCQINGEQQKSYKDVLSEVVITMELSNLRKSDYFHTSNFPELIRCWCVQGIYPSQLLVLWHEYDEEKTSENDSPEILPEDQIYIILQLANVGSAMENYTFHSAKQALSAFFQVTYTLAVAESSLEFEHRDLHWGNILIQPTKKRKIIYKMHGEDVQVQSSGIQASIIDFTLSRMTYEGCCIFNNLADDPALFEGEGDYQFDIYRLMKDHTENKWHVFEPYNNVLWLSYLLQKLISEVYYRDKSSRAHNKAMSRLKELRDKILNFRTVWEVAKTFS